MIPETQIAALRAFNRLYTRKLGLLNPHLDASPFSLTEARILYEIAHRTDPSAAEITRALGLDPAQLSRTLKRFEARGLVQTAQHPGGGRSRSIRLTAAGRQAFAALDRNTHDAIAGLLRDLPLPKREALLAAARSIGEVFDESPAAEVVLRDLRPGDLGWIVHRQAVLYAQEYGWTQEYEALAARILADFVQAFDPAREAAWVAEIDGRVVGSIFLVRGDAPEVGKLRLLYVEPDTRGRGVGAMLVQACTEQARAVGYRRLELWTNSVLTAARRIYQRAGFVMIDEKPHHAFGHDLVGQTWSLDLT
ncbi:bifunctional helix-turn-helix transcriptional regulator/GNAT family N-acetyltransferase [Caulobacter sp.]|uniref:bifunctional helix-turn-helix transcriptional regulator/GNAT family N-acetyltransferase n=1 Tax=Caulobacter sp. TaxID=78 RepID=UPI003BB08017